MADKKEKVGISTDLSSKVVGNVELSNLSGHFYMVIDLYDYLTYKRIKVTRLDFDTSMGCKSPV